MDRETEIALIRRTLDHLAADTDMAPAEHRLAVAAYTDAARIGTRTCTSSGPRWPRISR